MVLIAIGIGTFMSALDGSVVNTILPVLRRYFQSSITEIEWVVTIYLLVASGLLLSFGRLGDLMGHKTVYISGFGIFISSSFLCSFSSSIQMLIISRGIQAVGAALIQANSPAILTSSFPSRQRGQALGLQATMTYLGLTIGPAIGGFLAEQFGWRSVFFINIPVGITAMGLSIISIKTDIKNVEIKSFDFIGAVLFLLGLVALLFGLNKGSTLGWDSIPITLLFLSAFILLGIFYMIERRGKSPMLDLRLFSNSIFTSSVISSIINYIGVYSIIFLMPFYLIQGRGINPGNAGVILTIMPLIMAMTAPIAGLISDRIGTRLPALLGMVFLTIGLFLLSRISVDTPIQDLAIRLGIAGFGIGCFISPNNSALLGSAPKTHLGIASGILATSRNFGMVLGVGLSGAIFATILNNSVLPPEISIFTAINISFLVSCLTTSIGIIIIGLVKIPKITFPIPPNEPK